MTNALRIIVLCVCAGLMAAAQTDGEWTANRIPGHTKVWSAERSSQEVARVAAAAAFAYSPTNPPPASGGNVVSVNGQTGAVTVTAEGIGALTSVTSSTLDMGTNAVLTELLYTPRIGFGGTSLDFWYNGLPVASVEYDGVGIFNRISLSGTEPGFMPIVVGTTTRCDNLNADLLDGLHASSFQLASASPGVAFTNLAVDKANVAMNNHLSTNDPHAGKYALQTGGKLTNATLVGATLDTLTFTPTGTNAHYTMTWDITNGTWVAREVIP